jgi:hypothetical protein
MSAGNAMSGIYVSTGTHAVQVDAFGASARINTANHTVEIKADGRTISQVQCSTLGGESKVRLWLTPRWLHRLLGESVTVKVRCKRSGFD